MMRDKFSKIQVKYSAAIIAVIIGVLVTFFFAYKLAPWIHTVNTRVRLYMEAPVGTKVSICWDKMKAQCLPFVPYSTKNQRIAKSGEIADLWLTELPPQPQYAIKIAFNSALTNVKFFRLSLDSTGVFMFGDKHGTGVGNVQLNLDRFKLVGISNKLINQVNYIDVKKGGEIKLDSTIYQNGNDIDRVNWPSLTLVWGLLLSMFFIFAIPVYLLLTYSTNNIGSANNVGSNNFSWWVLPIFGLLIFGMIALVVNSGVMFNAADPFGYLFLTLGKTWFDDVRPPGYPLFLGLAFSIFNNNLNGVILLQAVLLAASTVICAYALRKWIPPFASVVFVALCLFSPAQISWARWILRESVFASLLLLGTTAAICHYTSEKRTSTIWLFVFSIICGVAFIVRENGILLPVVLLPRLTAEIENRLKDNKKTFANRLKSIFFTSIRYLCPILVLGIIYVTFSSINYIKYGYFQFGRHQTSHADLARVIYAANSDARSILQPDSAVLSDVPRYDKWQFYSSYILVKDQASGGDPIYLSLFPSVIQATNGDKRANLLNTAHILNEMGQDMSKLVPLKAQMAGILRQYMEILSIDRVQTYPSELSNQASLDDLQQFLRGAGLQSVTVTLDQKNILPNGLVAKYYDLTQSYPWYVFLLIFATLSSVYILKWEDPIFLAPITFFMANCLLLLITRLVNARYIESVDVLLILQSILCVSLFFRRIKLKFFSATTNS